MTPKNKPVDYAEMMFSQFATFKQDYHSDMSLLHEKINRIEVQTTKTNGRVTALEQKHTDCPVWDLKTEVEKIITTNKNIKSIESERKKSAFNKIIIITSIVGAVAVILTTIMQISHLIEVSNKAQQTIISKK